MKYVIVNGADIVLSAPSENCREPRLHERKLKALFASQAVNPMLKKESGYEVASVSRDKVTYVMTHANTSLAEAKTAALEMLDAFGKSVRESGFVSAITGEWTGITSKENISRSEPVARSAREAVDGGNGADFRNFKSATTGLFVPGLTNTAIVALDDEVNGADGFIQRCYDREEAIQALVLAVDEDTGTAYDVDAIYQAEVDIGWPTYGQGE